MQTHNAAKSLNDTTPAGPREIADSIDRIAAMFTEISGELGRFSEQLRTQQAATAASQREPSDTKPSGRTPTPTGPPVQGPDLLRGEPVDTSYARPTEAPAAEAAGASPYETGNQALSRRFPKTLAWTGAAVLLLGVMVLLVLIVQNR